MKPPTQTELFPSLTLSSEASRDRAKTSQLPGRGQDSAGPDRGFGLSAPGLWASFDPVGHCLRMSVLSSSEVLTGCARIWRATATPSGRFWWVLASGSERPTDGSESGSWRTARAEDSESAGTHVTRGTAETLTAAARRSCPTPTQDDAGGRATRYKQGGTSLSAQAQPSAWPTATSRDCVSSGAANYSTESGRHSGTTLTDAANGLWATPQAQDSKQNGDRPRSAAVMLIQQARAGQLDPGSHSTSGKSRDWPNLVSTSPTGGRHDFDGGRGARKKLTVRGVLNSRWTLQLMGYSADWCDLPADTIERLSRRSATQLCRRSSPSSGKPSSKRTRG